MRLQNTHVKNDDESVCASIKCNQFEGGVAWKLCGQKSSDLENNNLFLQLVNEEESESLFVEERLWFQKCTVSKCAVIKTCTYTW